MSRSSTSTPAGAGERLDDGRKRVRRERGRLVRVRVDDLHRGATRYLLGSAMAFVPPARHLLRAKDLADARYFEPLDVDDLAARGRAVPRALQPRVPARVRRVAARSTCSRAGSSARRRCCGRPTARWRRSASRSACRASARSRRASRARSASRRPPTARSSRRPRTWRDVPACVLRAYGRPQHSTFREDRAAARLA